MNKKSGYQTISWFYDLYSRNLLELNPTYQRKSVWNQKYKDYFIDTLLLSYPCPAIFLYEEIGEDGVAKYSVVDGKQRLTTIFEFINNEFTVFENAVKSDLRGKYFNEFAKEVKVDFFRYNLSVEYLATTEEAIIQDIFERINKNIAKLTSQELRHARLDGQFIDAAEKLTEWMSEVLPHNIPRINRKSITQMKDTEYTSLLLLLLDEGVQGYLQHELDKAYTDRDTSWEKQPEVTAKFKSIINKINELIRANTSLLQNSRLQNQADLYAIFGAINEIGDGHIDYSASANNIYEFYSTVDKKPEENEDATAYYKTIRSNVNQGTVRQERINIIKKYFILNDSTS